MPFYYAIHSNLLIHWTGFDLDEKYDPSWGSRDKSETHCPKLEEEYLTRLLNILRYGFWMTPAQEEELTLDLGDKKYKLPEISRTCFTELRLSQARVHAKRYGRLGLGVKRPFVFKRGGRPVIYYGPKKHLKNDTFLENYAQVITEKGLLHYFKAMNSSDKPNYDFYAESEWRIICTEKQKDRKKIIDPRQVSNCELSNYFDSLPEATKEKLCHLIPLDGWLACIIYPSVSVKNRAQKDKQIIDEIKRLKASQNDHANRVEGGNLPVEMDIDMCRNF